MKQFANLNTVVQYIHRYRNILFEMLDKSADSVDPVNIGEVTTSHSDILYYDKPNLPGTEFKIPHHVVTTGPEVYIGEKKSSHSDKGVERQNTPSLNWNSGTKFMPDQGYNSYNVDYGSGTDDGPGKDYSVTYSQGDRVKTERWEKSTDYMDPNGKSDSVFVCVCVLETHIHTHMNMC